jgi:hypothetical protein
MFRALVTSSGRAIDTPCHRCQSAQVPSSRARANAAGLARDRPGGSHRSSSESRGTASGTGAGERGRGFRKRLFAHRPSGRWNLVRPVHRVDVSVRRVDSMEGRRRPTRPGCRCRRGQSLLGTRPHARLLGTPNVERTRAARGQRSNNRLRPATERPQRSLGSFPRVEQTHLGHRSSSNAGRVGFDRDRPRGVAGAG